MKKSPAQTESLAALRRKAEEKLRTTQEELEASRSRYAELYDFAPVGYFILYKDSLIREMNLTCALLLGTERGSLLNKPFVGFLAVPDDKNIYFKHREAASQ